MNGGLKFSFLICYYNSSRSIERCLLSIVNQREESFEIILIDDGSTDGWTPSNVNLISDCRVTYRRLSSNMGPAYARNVGLKLCKGEWIVILDADDAVREDRLMGLKPLLLDADVVADNPLMYDLSAGVEIRSVFRAFPTGRLSLSSFSTYSENRGLTDLGIVKPLFRRDFLVENDLTYDEDLRQGEDYMLIFSCLVAGARVELSPQSGYIYTMPIGPLSRHPAPSKTKMDGARVALKLQEIALRLREEGRVADAKSTLWARDRFITLGAVWKMLDELRSGHVAKAALAMLLKPTLIFSLFTMAQTARSLNAPTGSLSKGKMSGCR